MPDTYIIETINDMLKVPAALRGEMLRELEYALDLHQLAFGDDAERTPIRAMTWTHDGDKSVRLTDLAGEAILSLKVTQE